MPTKRAADFRYYSATHFLLRAGDAEFTVVFGIGEAEPNQAAEEMLIYEQSGLVMSVRAAKVLSRILSQAVQQIEQVTGNVIDLPDMGPGQPFGGH